MRRIQPATADAAAIAAGGDKIAVVAIAVVDIAVVAIAGGNVIAVVVIAQPSPLLSGLTTPTPTATAAPEPCRGGRITRTIQQRVKRHHRGRHGCCRCRWYHNTG